MKVFWDGSFNGNGREWWTIVKCANPLKVGTAMAAENVGVCVLTGVFDLTFFQCFCVQNVNLCLQLESPLFVGAERLGSKH